MNAVLAILFVLMLLTPCLLAFRGRSRDAAGEGETLPPPVMIEPRVLESQVREASALDYPRAGVMKAKTRPEPAAPRVVTQATATVGRPHPVQEAVAAPRALTLQQRVEQAEEEARIAGAAAMRARDLAREAHGRAVTLRAEVAFQTAQFARFIAAEAADAAYAAQIAYNEMRVWEQGLAHEPVEVPEPLETADGLEMVDEYEGITALENRRAA